MHIEDEPAYVLESRPYRETSLLLELLTPGHGRLAVVARSVRGDRPSQRHRRALLEPLRPLRVAVSGRGEVLSLQRVDDAGGQLSRPTGIALMSVFYVNELIRKMIPRNDPAPGVFALYQSWLQQMTACLPPVPGHPGTSVGPNGDGLRKLAWALRRFERDLLSELGYGLALDHDSDSGEPIRPKTHYVLDPEQGARTWTVDSPWRPVAGAVLLAWAGETCPDDGTAAELRRLAREVIRYHLGGSELEAWRLARRWQ